MIPRPHLTKVPGLIPALKPDKCIKDLSKLTRPELLEIKSREEKLLAKKINLNKLPDKGKRIKEFYEKVLLELETRDNINEAAEIFSQLNIASRGKAKLNQLEWEGRLKDSSNNECDHIDDVLDDLEETEMDPLKLIAQRTMHEKKTKILPPEKSLIKQSDLEEIDSFQKEPKPIVDAEIVNIDVNEKIPVLRAKLQQKAEKSVRCESTSSVSSEDISIDSHSELDPHVYYIVDKIVDKLPEKERFKPYKTTISNVHDPEKEKVRKKGKNWENTAATPPLIRHNGTKLLTLLDSVELQANYQAKLKKLQERKAVERLAAKIERLGSIKVPETTKNPAFTTYRDSSKIEGIHTYSDEDEIDDPLDVERSGNKVLYTVFE